MDIPHLTRCETEVMDVVWRLGRVTVQDVCDALDRPLAYTTVMTLLDKLARKKSVTRNKKGKAFIYAPNLSRQDVWDQAVEELTDSYFGGRREQLRRFLAAEKPDSKVRPPAKEPDSLTEQDMDVVLL